MKCFDCGALLSNKRIATFTNPRTPRVCLDCQKYYDRRNKPQVDLGLDEEALYEIVGGR